MEQETLFTASKWDILKLLSEQSLSPIELAARSSTSVANVSQQLRLLEMAGLVKSERVPNRDKGQPRVLYSLAGNHSYLIATTSDFVQKKLFQLSALNKIILRIWFFERQDLHYCIEKAFWNIEPHLALIDGIAVRMKGEQPSLVLFSRNAKLAPTPLVVAAPQGKCTIRYEVLHPDKISAKSELYPLHDPANILGTRSREEKIGTKGDV